MTLEQTICIILAATIVLFIIALFILQMQNYKIREEYNTLEKVKKEQEKYLKWVNEQLHIQNKYLKINQAKCRIYKKYYEHNKKGF